MHFCGELDPRARTLEAAERAAPPNADSPPLRRRTAHIFVFIISCAALVSSHAPWPSLLPDSTIRQARPLPAPRRGRSER